MRPRLALYLESFSGLGPDEREDVLQTVSISLWRNAGKIGAAPERWLYRAARNAAIDALRRKAREGRRAARPGPGGDAEIEAAPSAWQGPEDAALSGEELDFVRGFLARLEDPERELLHLAFAEGMAYRDIGALLAMPLGTVKWKVAALKRRLALAYGKEFG
jgi:RNA polymerase sigma-70 factor (ECF subfamily)